MFTNRRPPATAFERYAAKPAPVATRPKPPARWRAVVAFTADGERDTFTHEVDATSRDAAIEQVTALSQREYGGDWDSITHTSAIRIKR